jgi:hypothetical protein
MKSDGALNGIMRLLVVLCMAWFPSIALCDQVTEQQAMERAKYAVRASTDMQAIYLRVVRREDLEDDIFLCQDKNSGDYKKFAYIYELFDNGIEISAPRKYALHMGIGWWCVAVAREAGRVYCLRGFDKAHEAFNLMAADAAVRIEDDTTASIYKKLYNYVVLKNDYGILVDNRSELRREVDSYLCSYDETYKTCEKKFRKWWNGFISSGITLKGHDRAVNLGTSYLVSMFAIQQTDLRAPLLNKITYVISKIGSVNTLEVKSLYPESLLGRLPLSVQ